MGVQDAARPSAFCEGDGGRRAGRHEQPGVRVTRDAGRPAPGAAVCRTPASVKLSVKESSRGGRDAGQARPCGIGRQRPYCSFNATRAYILRLGGVLPQGYRQQPAAAQVWGARQITRIAQRTVRRIGQGSRCTILHITAGGFPVPATRAVLPGLRRLGADRPFVPRSMKKLLIVRTPVLRRTLAEHAMADAFLALRRLTRTTWSRTSACTPVGARDRHRPVVGLGEDPRGEEFIHLGSLQQAKLTLFDNYTMQFQSSDLIVVANPLWNLSVPTRLKAWVTPSAGRGHLPLQQRAAPRPAAAGRSSTYRPAAATSAARTRPANGCAPCSPSSAAISSSTWPRAWITHPSAPTRS